MASLAGEAMSVCVCVCVFLCLCVFVYGCVFVCVSAQGAQSAHIPFWELSSPK